MSAAAEGAKETTALTGSDSRVRPFVALELRLRHLEPPMEKTIWEFMVKISLPIADL